MQTHSSQVSSENLPVIVGVGQLLDRPNEPAHGIDPIELICKAIQIATENTGCDLLQLVDSLDIENITSKAYVNAATEITSRLGLTPKHCAYHEVSGDLPVRHLGQIAHRIAKGISTVAILCGGESTWTINRSRRIATKHDQAHTPPSSSTAWKPQVEEMVKKYHLDIPVRAYALYENACRSHWQQSFQDAQLETGELQAHASLIATNNPFSWGKTSKSAQEIITPSAKNRLIAWPYTKLMVANNAINSGTAIIITSLRIARELGIDERKLIYIHAASHASEPTNILARDNYVHSAAMEAVFESLFNATQTTIQDMDYTEIYSCFPCVIKMAKKIIRPDANQSLTVTGGMTFCRGQFSNFMSQAIVSMVTALRKKGKYGLLYGNGHYLTHASGAIISSEKPSLINFPGELNCQENANLKMEPIPLLLEEYDGMGVVETYTVIFDHEGHPKYALVIARTPEGFRFLAKTKNDDNMGYAPFLDTQHNPIGSKGYSKHLGKYNQWTCALG